MRVLSGGGNDRKHQNYLEIRNWTEGKKGTQFCDDKNYLTDSLLPLKQRFLISSF